MGIPIPILAFPVASSLSTVLHPWGCGWCIWAYS